MNTQTHALLALALFSKREAPARNWAVLAGALVTDIFIYVGLVYYGLITGDGIGAYFNTIYFQPHMQFWSALSNALPIFTALAVIGYAFRQHKWAVLLLFFALAAFTQSLIDLPVHADDAHRHFWPITDWRFYSPISYWDPAHYGRIIGQIDNLLGLICIAILWRRHPALRVKVVLSALIVLYFLFVLLPFIAPFIFAG